MRRPGERQQGAEGEDAAAPAELPSLVSLCRDELGLSVEGLMAIPPEGEDVAPHAALLAKLAGRHGLPAVSVVGGWLVSTSLAGAAGVTATDPVIATARLPLAASKV